MNPFLGLSLPLLFKMDLVVLIFESVTAIKEVTRCLQFVTHAPARALTARGRWLASTARNTPIL